MIRTGSQRIAFTLTAALIIFGSVVSSPSAQAQVPYGPATVHPPSPGGYKSPLQVRYLWPIKPIKIIDNVYHVGLSGMEAYLITTPQGHFLNVFSVADEIAISMKELGLDIKDVKYLLTAHPHHSHSAELTKLKRMTGAKVLVMEQDVASFADGGEKENFLPNMLGPVFEPVKADQVLKHGDKITLGGVTVTAHLTPGHTPGCTTYTTEATENGKKYTVALFGGCTSMNQPLVGNRFNPRIIEDFELQYKNLRAIKVDVLLGAARGLHYEEVAKLRESNPGINPFVDPKGYVAWIDRNEKRFKEQVAKERAGGQAWSIAIPAPEECPKDAPACYNSHDIILECCEKLGAIPVPYTMTTLDWASTKPTGKTRKR